MTARSFMEARNWSIDRLLDSTLRPYLLAGIASASITITFHDDAATEPASSYPPASFPMTKRTRH